MTGPTRLPLGGFMATLVVLIVKAPNTGVGWPDRG
jgi:hypothetical protein